MAKLTKALVAAQERLTGLRVAMRNEDGGKPQYAIKLQRAMQKLFERSLIRDPLVFENVQEARELLVPDDRGAVVGDGIVSQPHP